MTSSSSSISTTSSVGTSSTSTSGTSTASVTDRHLLGGRLGDARGGHGHAILEAAVLGTILAGCDRLAGRGHEVTEVEPALHADAPERGARLGLAVVDVGAQRVQRHAAVAIPLATRHLGAAEPAAHLDLHALGAGAHAAHQRLLERAAEGDALLELRGDVLGDQRRVELGRLDLVDGDPHLLAGDPLELVAQRVDRRALLADDDAGLGGLDDHGELVGAALGLDARQAGVAQAAADEAAHGDVLVEELGVVLVGVPARVPVAVDAEPETDRIDFLTHLLSLFRGRLGCAAACRAWLGGGRFGARGRRAVAAGVTTGVGTTVRGIFTALRRRTFAGASSSVTKARRWLVRLKMLPAMPRGLAPPALDDHGAVNLDARDAQRGRVEVVVVLGVGGRGLDHLGDVDARPSAARTGAPPAPRRPAGPVTIADTRRALRAVVRTHFAVATTSISSYFSAVLRSVWWPCPR